MHQEVVGVVWKVPSTVPEPAAPMARIPEHSKHTHGRRWEQKWITMKEAKAEAGHRVRHPAFHEPLPAASSARCFLNCVRVAAEVPDARAHSLHGSV